MELALKATPSAIRFMTEYMSILPKDLLVGLMRKDVETIDFLPSELKKDRKLFLNLVEE